MHALRTRELVVSFAKGEMNDQHCLDGRRDNTGERTKLAQADTTPAILYACPRKRRVQTVTSAHNALSQPSLLTARASGAAHRLRKTVPASMPSANTSSNTLSDSGREASVQTDAVSPYGESFMSSSAAASEGTFTRPRSAAAKDRRGKGWHLLDADDGTKGFLLQACKHVRSSTSASDVRSSLPLLRRSSGLGSAH